MEHHKEVGLNNYAMKNSSLEEVIEIIGRFVIGAKPCSPREIVDACASAYTPNRNMKQGCWYGSGCTSLFQEDFPSVQWSDPEPTPATITIKIEK